MCKFHKSSISFNLTRFYYILLFFYYLLFDDSLFAYVTHILLSVFSSSSSFYNLIKSNQIKSNQIKSNQIKSKQI